MSDRPTPRTDSAIMEIPSKFGSICVVRVELALDLERELGEALQERDELREELAEAKREAENLAKSIYRSEYSDNDTDWELLDSVAGVISQIDNMYAGVREQRDEARQEWGKASMDAAQLLSEKTKVIAERDEARESAAKWEAVALREASINGARICAKEDAK